MHNDKKLRLIQVGVSGWGESWLERIRRSDDWEVVALVNRSERGLQQARDRFGYTADQCFNTLAEAINTPADAVLIVSPGQQHRADALAAFGAGLHVLVEKPMATDMASAKDMVAAADGAGRVLMVSQNYRFRKAAREVARLIGEGWLGEVKHASIDFRKEIHYTTPDVPHGFADFELIRDCSIHHFDQLRGLLHREPVSATAVTGNPSWSWFTHPPLVDALIELDNGGVVHYHGSWISRGRESTWDGDWYIECENGQIDFRDNRVRVRPEDNWRSIQMDGYLERDGWFEAQLDPNSQEDRSYALAEFTQAIRTARQPGTSGRDNLRSLALTHAVRDSAASSLPRAVAEYLD